MASCTRLNGSSVHLAQGLKRLVVHEQNEMFAYRVGFEKIHGPHSHIHFEQEGV